MKKAKVRFLKDYTHKIGVKKEDGKEVEVFETVKKGEEMELYLPIIDRLRANPDNVVVEKI